MSNKMREISLQQKVKVLAKLFEAGCKTENNLKTLNLSSVLNIPGMTMADMMIVSDIQQYVAKNQLYSYLSGIDDGQI